MDPVSRIHLYRPRYLPTLLLLSLFLVSCSAQTILTFGTGGLPACAQQCQLLTQAQAACVPPAAPVTTQQTYVGCFCQSAYLVNLKTDATNVCGNVCQGADLSLVSQWFVTLCANPATIQATTQSTTTTAAAAAAAGGQTTTTAAAAAAATTTTSSAQTSQSSSASTQTPNKTWWAGHWKWVLMIALVLGLLAILSVIAIFVRRRVRKRRDAMGGRFNDGITSRTMTTNPTAVKGFPYTSGDVGRETPPGLSSTRGSDSRLASSATLSRPSNRAEPSKLADIASASSENLDQVGTQTPVGKGKSKARVSEDEVRP